MEQSFVTATKTWVINHGQGTKGLTVETYDTDGTQVNGEVSKPDDNTIQIVFYHPMAGKALVFV